MHQNTLYDNDCFRKPELVNTMAYSLIEREMDLGMSGGTLYCDQDCESLDSEDGKSNDGESDDSESKRWDEHAIG